jgi:mannose-6-phosphate isomerase-like protein (cupin superfamily)
MCKKKMVEILTPDFEFPDERGKLVQLVHGGYAQVNVIQTFAGKTRGKKHYHKTNSELFYIISGKVTLDCESLIEHNTERFTFSGGDMFRIPPYVGHSFLFEEDTLMVSLYTEGVELGDTQKDIYEME